MPGFGGDDVGHRNTALQRIEYVHTVGKDDATRRESLKRAFCKPLETDEQSSSAFEPLAQLSLEGVQLLRISLRTVPFRLEQICRTAVLERAVDLLPGQPKPSLCIHVPGVEQGGEKGHRALDEEREEIIRATISAHYLKQTRPTISQLVRDVQTNCVSAGLKPPHRRTIVTRLHDIDLQKRAQRRGEQKIVKATTPVPGGFGASRPLEVVQMDHTKADVFVVDEETRQPLGRPWLTLAMDVCSRMVTGFYLTMDAPSRLDTRLPPRGP